MTVISHEAVIARWEDPSARPLFKGKLIDEDGCCCAQGDILRTFCGWTDEQLRKVNVQAKADAEVAQALGISRFQAVLLRIVNDCQDGCPQDVLRAPEKVLGDQAHILLALGRHLDRMTPTQWDAAWAAARDAAGAAARDAARDAAMDAARDAAGDAAWAAAGAAARAAAGAAARDAAGAAAGDAAWAAAGAAARAAAGAAARAAAGAAAEIQGARVLREQGRPFFFLPLFGFADPEAVLAGDEQ
jgi:hypothetical protein